MFRTNALVGALLFLAGAALACGPYFPWQLLDNRTVTLKSTPHNSFAFEASHLAGPPTDRLKAIEPDDYTNADITRENDLSANEAKGLTSDQVDQLGKVRGTASGAEAYAAAEGLPPAVRLYTAGAVAFRKNDLADAEKRFAAVLNLPSAARASRATWAAFMAAKTDCLSGDDDKAATMFARTRELARAGAPDPMGLAVASYGEEAKLHYELADGSLVVPSTPSEPTDASQAVPVDPYLANATLPDERANAYRNEMAMAAGLYAEQAARGSNGGVQSLRMIAENILTRSDRIDAAVTSPLLERLVVVYALARLHDGTGDYGAVDDAGTRIRGVTLNAGLPPLVDAIVKHGGASPAGADRLAALSYRTGRYDLAVQMADKSASPLAEWVKAKIALQKGDLDAAARHYAAASKGFLAANSETFDPDNGNRLVGEEAVVTLARGDYIDALDKLYSHAGTYWGDVAYIAERVLTVDELRTFVDTHAAPQKSAEHDAGLGSTTNPGEGIRDLLARRLMREGRYAAAFRYFSDAKIRDKAKAYAMAVHEANTDWLPVDRAEAFFAAAKLARESGMDFLGTEAAPDYFAMSGDFDCCVGQDKPKGEFVTADERARDRASAPAPDQRFHYRYIATDEAVGAADLLPQRSQAFAASLCWADGWMMETNQDDRARAIYKRYVTQGPHVAWAKHFGRNCPEPNFASAGALERREIYHHARHYASRRRWWIAGGTGGLLVAFSGLVLARRRRVTPPS